MLYIENLDPEWTSCKQINEKVKSWGSKFLHDWQLELDKGTESSLTEYYQMNTNISGFQSSILIYFHYSVILNKLAASS